MKRKSRHPLTPSPPHLIIALLLLLGLGAAALAMAQGGTSVSSFTVDGGGGFSGGDGWTLGGSIGQADAGRLAGGGYELSGGFWQEGVVAPEVTPTPTPPPTPPPADLGQDVYLPVVIKNGS